MLGYQLFTRMAEHILQLIKTDADLSVQLSGLESKARTLSHRTSINKVLAMPFETMILCDKKNGTRKAHLQHNSYIR